MSVSSRTALPFSNANPDAKPIWMVTTDDMQSGDLPDHVQDWASANRFTGTAGAYLAVPDQSDAAVAGALFGLGGTTDAKPFIAGKLATLLPDGAWRFEGHADDHARFALAYGMGAYRFDRYRSGKSDRQVSEGGAVLCLADGRDRSDIERQVRGVLLARDLINTPANDMGPDALEEAVRALAAEFGASVSTIAGEALLAQNFPLIHAVGRASDQAPRLLDMRFGREDAPTVTLVGKGVCFDTGGLDIKPASNMLLMKKDMGGAANVLGLALMLMDSGLDIRLRVLIPAVENAIAGNAFRPGDVLASRKGLTVEIGNTDAEGRLVLADALAYGDEEAPDLMIDMATLTGAARVALGPDVPPYFTDDADLVREIDRASVDENDPLWRLPLFAGYEGDIAGKVGDLNNAPSGGFAGSITAALFLKRFVGQARSWAHLDIYGWNPKERPHAPLGGEAQGIRALYRVLTQRYGG